MSPLFTGKDKTPIAEPSEAERVRRLGRNVMVHAGLGLLVVGFAVAVVALFVLHRDYTGSSRNNFHLTLATKAATVDSYLQGLKNIAAQVTSRSFIRDTLESYSRGEIDLAALKEITEPKLLDAMSHSSEIAGITRLDEANRPVTEIGRQIPAQWWPEPPSGAEDIRLRGVLLPGPEFLITVSAPIVNRQGGRLGTDIVCFQPDYLRQLILDYTGLGETGEMIVGMADKSGATYFFPLRHEGATGSHPAADEMLNKVLVRTTTQGKSDSMANGEIIASMPLAETSWAVVLRRQRSELYGAVYRDLGRIALTFVLMIIGGMVVVCLSMRPIIVSLRRIVDFSRQLLDSSPDAIFVLDEKGFFLDVNRTAESRYGYERGEFLSMSARELTDPEQREEVSARVKEALTSGTKFEWLHLCRNGQVIPVEIAAAPFINTDGKTRILSSVRDISARKEAEGKQRHLHDLMRYVIEHTRSAVAVFDRDMKYIFVSRSFLDQHKVAEKNVIGRCHYDIFPDLPRKWRDVHRRVLRGEVESAVDDPYEKADGTVEWMSWECRPWYEANGSVGGLIIYTEVTTERRQAVEELRRHRDKLAELVNERTEELQNNERALLNLVEDINDKSKELEDANKHLQDLDRLKSLFIASMSHELRTPLNSVIGFSSILKAEWLGPVNDEQKKNLGYILDSGKHLLALINDVIDLSKVEAGRLEITPSEFFLADLVAEAVNAIRQSAAEKGLAIDTRIEPCALFADRRRLLQCLLNLLSNAVKFTAKGSITVTAETGVGKDNAAVIKLVVKDTGIGISSADQGRLFKPFVRLHPPGSSEYPGTGLGLYLTGKLVNEVLQGEIHVASAHGAGSRFTIEMPARLQPGRRKGT